jgi:hypothetical protein
LTLLLRGQLMLVLRSSLHGSLLCPATLLRVCLIARLHRRRRPDIAIRLERLADGKTGWTAIVDAGKLGAVDAGNMLIL